MNIQYKGKKYDSETWHKPILEKLLSKRLKEVRLELSKLRADKPLDYQNLIMELMSEESQLKYTLDQLRGVPIL
jgi:hypothetical protein